jgi:hypothetical protein
MASSKSRLRTLGRVDYGLLSGGKASASANQSALESPRGDEEATTVSDSEIDLLERSVRELELEEKKLRLQQLLKEKLKSVEELRAAVASDGTSRQQSSNAAASNVPASNAPASNAPASNAPARAARTHAKRLVDFVPNHSRPEEVELSDGVYVRKDKPVKLESVNPAQWVVASNKILLAMWDESHMSLQEVRDYINHQIKIGELATRYTWASVIQYDQEYRDKQAEMQYSFGSDAGHLSRVILRDRDSVSKQPQTKAKAKYKDSHSVCLLFNTEKGCHFASKCKFEHVCSVCMKGHSRMEHPGEATKTNSV